LTTFSLIARIIFFSVSCVPLVSLTTGALAQGFPGTTLPGRAGGFGGQTGGQPGAGRSSSTGRSTIDDSTKVIYGPRTTRYFLEADVLNNRKTLFTTDTLLDGVHLYNFVQRNGNLYQDLGNLGTPLRPVFYQEPTQIGAQTGYSVFAPYAYQLSQIKYYDTKSPFTRMYFVLGGRNQNVLNFDFSQNVNPRLNFGFNAQRVTSRKQFGVAATTSASSNAIFLVQSWAFVGHMNYRTKDEKYTLLLHFNHLNHDLPEQGGLLPNPRTDGTKDFFHYDGNPRLNNADGKELRNRWHAYQQYKIAEGFQLFHRLDYLRQINSFNDYSLQTDSTLTRFYPTVIRSQYPNTVRRAELDSTATFQDNRYRLLENQFGIKGDFKGFNYRAYVRNRVYGQEGRYNRLPSKQDSTSFWGTYNNPKLRQETFLGLWLGYYFPDSLTRLTAEGEYLVGRDLRLEGQLETRFATVGYRSVFASPTLLQQRFESNNYSWANNFGLCGTQHAYGTLNLKYKTVQIQPGLDYFLLNNYVYFDEDARPQQLGSAFSMVRVGLGASAGKGRWKAQTQGYYTLISRSDIMRAPKLFVNARATYDFIFKKVLFIQTGVELHYKSSYFADAYMPLTQQFYLQNKQKVEGYVLADVFANFRINRTRLFVKMAHVNQGVLAPGYYVTPDYLAMRRSFAFGVDWYLFD